MTTSCRNCSGCWQNKKRERKLLFLKNKEEIIKNKNRCKPVSAEPTFIITRVKTRISSPQVISSRSDFIRSLRRTDFIFFGAPRPPLVNPHCSLCSQRGTPRLRPKPHHPPDILSGLFADEKRAINDRPYSFLILNSGGQTPPIHYSVAGSSRVNRLLSQSISYFSPSGSMPIGYA